MLYVHVYIVAIEQMYRISSHVHTDIIKDMSNHHFSELETVH
jgi:hypothetical protein